MNKKKMFFKGLLINLFMAIVMSTVISFVMTSVNVGFADMHIFGIAFLNSLWISFLVSFICGLIFNPLMAKLAGLIIKD